MPLEELDFRGLVTLTDNEQGPSTHVHWSYPPCRPVAIPVAGTVGSPDSLPLRTTLVQDPRAAIQSQQRVEYEDYSLIAPLDVARQSRGRGLRRCLHCTVPMQL